MTPDTPVGEERFLVFLFDEIQLVRYVRLSPIRVLTYFTKSYKRLVYLTGI